MKEKFRKYIKEIIVFAVVLFIAMNIVSYYRALDINKEVLDIKNFTLIDGSKYILKGDKTLLIYFWATWCPICKFQSPNIEKLSKEFEVVTVAVQSGDDVDVKKYLEKNNFTFRVLNDKNAIYSNKFNISVFPTILIYDKEKRQSFSEVGYTSTLGLYFRLLYTSL